MRFDWDAKKDRANRAKHGVGFSLACEVFNDPLHLSITDGVEVIRIISARKATRHERKRYEQG